VDAKYGSSWAGWCSLHPHGSHGVGLWKNIRKGWSLFSSHSRFILGNGSRIRFWDDVWCGEMPLKEVFPGLYDIACDKNSSVAAHLILESRSFQWDVRFIRAAHDWEVDVLTSFFTLLYSISLDRDGEDKLWWSPSRKVKFDVIFFYKSLAFKETSYFPWKSIWHTKVPLKVAFQAWAAALGKILTVDNLRKRRVIVIDRCCMCKKSGESVDHLFFHCDAACVLWNAIFSRFSLSWVMHRQVVDLFACWWTCGRS
jgi:hypothetical protein